VGLEIHKELHFHGFAIEERTGCRGRHWRSIKWSGIFPCVGIDIDSDTDLLSPDADSGPEESQKSFPVLTIICHGNVTRAGERVMLRGLLDGQRMAIHRLEPTFMAPDGQLTGPLEDSFISRRALWLKWSSGGLRIDPSELTTELCIDGYPMEEARTIAHEQLKRGLVLKLADRVLLFLRQRDPDSLFSPPIRGLLGESASMVQLREQATLVGATDGHVLLQGSQGTEVENLARAIHAKGSSPALPFVAVGVTSIPAEHLMEALFGTHASMDKAREKPTAMSTLDLDENEAGFQAVTTSLDGQIDDEGSEASDPQASTEALMVDEDSERGFESVPVAESADESVEVTGYTADGLDEPEADSPALYEISSDESEDDDDLEMALSTLDMVDSSPVPNRASSTLDLLDEDFSLENLAKNRLGFFGKAAGGVLYLEEVDELPLEVQKRLVALMTLMSIEGEAPRIIASTDADLELAVEEGFFEADLLDLLCEAMVEMPPLSERLEDLGQVFVDSLFSEMAETGEENLLEDQGAKRPPWLPADLLGRFLKYDWPGNVTQLRAVARCLVSSSRGAFTVRISEAVEMLLPEAPAKVIDTMPDHSGYEIEGLGDSQQDRYLDVIRNCRWNVATAAKRLRISKPALNQWIESCKELRGIENISAEEFLQATRRYHGHIGLIANTLEVSRRQLVRRLKELDML
jgi:DNA-binding NtrC family response regulator